MIFNKTLTYITVFCLISLISALIQAQLRSLFFDYQFILPNLPLIITIFLGFFDQKIIGVVLCFLLGIIYDLSLGNIIGPWAGSFVCIHLSFALFAQRIFVHSYSSILFAVLIGTIFSNFIAFIIMRMVQERQMISLMELLVESFTTALVAPFLFKLLEKAQLFALQNSGIKRRRNAF